MFISQDVALIYKTLLSIIDVKYEKILINRPQGMTSSNSNKNVQSQQQPRSLSSLETIDRERETAKYEQKGSDKNMNFEKNAVPSTTTTLEKKPQSREIINIQPQPNSNTNHLFNQNYEKYKLDSKNSGGSNKLQPQIILDNNDKKSKEQQNKGLRMISFNL